MPIRPSSSAKIRPLIEALASPDPIARESAVARLRLLGESAIEPLLRAYPKADGRLQTGILQALDQVTDPRLLALAREAMDSSDAGLRSAAVGTLRRLASSATPLAPDALDALIAAAMDAGRPRDLRVAALDGLQDQPDEMRRRVAETLANDPEAPNAARRESGADGGGPAEAWRDAVAGRLPSTVAAARALLPAWIPRARLTELQRVIDHVRNRERGEDDVLTREEWRALRGRVHQELAARHSRIALYDLRDSLTEPARLPVAFLAALEEIGDDTCLEPLAAAFDASSRSSDPWWREHLARAFRAIVDREGLSRRHASVKRVASRWPDAAAELLGR